MCIRIAQAPSYTPTSAAAASVDKEDRSMFQMHPSTIESKNGLGLAQARQLNTFSNSRRGKGGKGAKGGKVRRNYRFDNHKGARFEDQTNDGHDDSRNNRDEL